MESQALVLLLLEIRLCPSGVHYGKQFMGALR